MTIVTPARSRRSSRAPRRAIAAAAVLLVVAGFAIGGGLQPPPDDRAGLGEASEPATPRASTTPAPAAEPEPEPEPEPSPEPLSADLAELQRQLTSIVTSEDFATTSATVAVAVRDSDGRDVVDINSDVPLLPASTMKLFTAAAALIEFGPGHRLTTTAASTVPVDSFGYLAGDLVLQGGGDPVLATDEYGIHVYPSRPRSRLEDLADNVAASGLRWVSGNVVADGTGWGGRPLAPGWRDVYLNDQDARRITPLTVDAGLLVDVEIDDEVNVRLTLADDPAARAADEFARLLSERGIHVAGVGMSALQPVPAEYEVAEVASPPLRELLQFMVQRSDNHIADTLFRHLGQQLVGDAGWEQAGVAIVDLLADAGIDPTGLVLVDGSGLSRDNRVTAGALADLDAVMAKSPHADVWAELMAVTGESGTLRRRLVGTHGQGRFYGKTGTLDDVKAIAGFVSDGRERLHLSVVANDLGGGDRWVVIVLMDELTLRLVEFADDCRREPTGEPPASEGPPVVTPYALVCPGT